MKTQYLSLSFVFLFMMLLVGTNSKAQIHPDTILSLPIVVITDSTIHRLLPRSTVEIEIIRRNPSADLGEILRGEPNVSGIRRGGFAVDPVVRGFRYSQLNVHLDDGIHIEGGCPNRMDPVMSHIDNEDIERVEIIRGPYLMQYGPTQGASIRLITQKENPFTNKKLQLLSSTGYDANRGGFRQHLSVSGSTDRLYLKLAGGIKDYGNYTDGNGTEWKSSFRKKDISTDIGYRTSASSTLFISYKGSFGRDVLFPALPMDEIADNTHIFSASYTHRNPEIPENTFKLSAYHTRVYHEMDNRFRPQFNQITPPYTGLMQAVAKVNTSTSGLRLILEQKHGQYLLQGGFDSEITAKDGTRYTKMIMQMDDQEFTSQKNFNLWKEAWIHNTGLFAAISSPLRKITWRAAARIDLNRSDSKDTLIIIKESTSWFEVLPETQVNLSLSGSAAWHINNQLSLTLGMARGVRSPDMQERYIKFLATGYDRYDYLGNPNLKPEINHQVDLMLDYRSNDFRLFTNLFRSYIHNFITGILAPPAILRPLSMGAPGVKQFNNIERAVLYGFEAGISAQPIEKLMVSLSSGYTYAYFPEIEKIILEGSQATGSVILKNDPIPEIPALEAFFRASYTLWNSRLMPSLEIRAVGDQKHVSGASNEESTPGYILMNIAARFKACKCADINFGVNNLFNKAYYDHLNRKLIGTQSRYYEPGRTFFANLIIKI
jgi:iron complex outermembrane receptor protein